MSRPIAPGQTVPVPFTLSETPDSTPTVTVYQSTAAGVLSDVSATTAPTVTLLSGLAYHAYYTVPAAAVHGSAYRLLVSVVIAGETTVHWLDGGTVELWASQASVDAVAELFAGGSVVVTSPVDRTGSRIVLRLIRGDSYEVGSMHGPINIDVEDVANWPDLTSATVTLTVRVKRGRDDTTDPAVVLSKVGSVVTPTGATRTFRFQPTAAETAAALVGLHEFDVSIDPGTGKPLTLGPSMPCYVLADQTV